MNERFDVAVIGAGLAGSCAAILAAQSGAKVVLLEGAQVGRHKVCGEFLSPESRVQLRQLGVLEALQNAGAQTVTTARISTSSRRGRAIALTGEGLAISRAALDTILWERAQKAGVLVRDHTRVQSIERPTQDHFTLETTKGQIDSRFVISATGRSSKWGRDADADHAPTSRFVGLKTQLENVRLPRGEVALFPFAGGYCGLVEVEEGRVNACILAPYARLKNSSPELLWEAIGRENRFLGEAVQNARSLFPWKATGNVSFSSFAPVRDGVLRIGDAAGYIHPLSGDGMAMALRSGELAARSVQSALKWNRSPENIAHAYAQMWQREFGKRLYWASLLQPLFVNARVSDAALRLSDALPVLARLAATYTRGQVSS